MEDAYEPLGARCFTRERDTPTAGVTFYDFQPLLNSPTTQLAIAARLCAEMEGDARLPAKAVTHVLACEMRGLFLGTWLAQYLSVPLVPVRKFASAARLVRDPQKDLVASPAYGTEYAAATVDARMCVRRGALPAGAHCIVVDDVLATGGSMRAALAVAAACGATVHAGVVLLYVSQKCAWMDVPVF
jgi:adenine phosphoribosyltransferase